MNEFLKKHNLPSLEDYLKTAEFDNESVAKTTYYRFILTQTDYIASKLAEGVATKEEYANDIEVREFARSEIRRLEGGEQK